MNKIDYPFSKEQLLPQEERLELNQIKKEFIIGVPKEDDINEERICLSPAYSMVLLKLPESSIKVSPKFHVVHIALRSSPSSLLHSVPFRCLSTGDVLAMFSESCIFIIISVVNQKLM